MDPTLVDLTRRLAAGDPAARAELASHPGEMARALDSLLTSLERRTAQLAETEQYFLALTRQSLIGICVATRDRILYVNDALAGMVGYTTAEILDFADFLDVVHPYDRPTASRNLERRFRGETFRATFRLLRKGGGTVLVEADGRRVLRRGEPVIIASFVARDAHGRGNTEARKERQALFRSEKMAMLGDLVSGLAHELSSPLMLILTQAYLIERFANAGPVAERAHSIAGQAERAAQIATRITSLLRDYPQETGIVWLNNVVRDVVELFGYSLRDARIDVTIELADGLPSILADSHRVHELVAHLVANAVQAMRGRPAPRRLTIRTVVVPSTARVCSNLSSRRSQPALEPGSASMCARRSPRSAAAPSSFSSGRAPGPRSASSCPSERRLPHDPRRWWPSS